MSAIFGETITLGQATGPDVQLLVTGDEFYARHETLDGYTAVYDSGRGVFCYATLVNGALASTGVPVTGPAPAYLRKHLQESATIRARRFDARRTRSRPPLAMRSANEASRTFGPEQGLLEGRRLNSGAVRGLTILVEFQDVTTTVTRADVDALLNGQNYRLNGNFCSAREYFSLVSSGKLDYTNEVVGPFRLSQPRSYYVNKLLIEEALNLAIAAGTDLTRYDSRGEGILDALNVMYAGQTQYNGELWPHNSFIQLRRGAISTNLYLLTSLGRTPADLSIGTFCHENGHLLCRFPDMYDYGDVSRDGDGVKSAGIGSYCLMGSGNHLNYGRTPSPVCAYLRDLAGWCDNEVDLAAAGEYSAIHGSYNQVIKYRGPSPNEYFLVENRSKIGLDTHLPSSGLAVYHCDILGSNEFQDGTAQKHYQCALLQADGHRDLETNANQGDGTDLFSAAEGTALSSATRPASRLWNGSDSGLVISEIEVPGPTIKFRVGSPTAAATVRGENATAVTIPDNNRAGIKSIVKIASAGALKQMVVKVDITHTYIGDLQVELIGPGGQLAVLHKRSDGNADNLIRSYDLTSQPALSIFVGKAVSGDWTLAVKDMAGQDVGKLNRWAIELLTDAGPQAIRGDAAPALTIPDNQPSGIASTISLAGTGTARRIKVSVDITHTYIGDLRMELVAPGGRGAALHSQLGGSQDNLVVTYDSSAPNSPLSGLVGQSIPGSWVLRVADLASADVGTLNRWSLEITPD